MQEAFLSLGAIQVIGSGKSNGGIQSKMNLLTQEERDLRSWCRAETNRLIRNGLMTRMPCEKCGCAQADAHHPDYSNPRLVQWLCIPHHRVAHGKKWNPTMPRKIQKKICAPDPVPVPIPIFKPLVKTRKMAEILGISKFKLRCMVKSRAIPFLRSPGGTLAFDADEVLASLGKTK